MPYIFLTDSDHAALREMLRERQGGRVNAPNRQPSRLAEEQSGHQAPEVYIALTPTDGIPARVGTTPGSAECVIQHVDSTGDLAEVASFTQPVYNVATSAVAGGEYISVKRDKYGTWLADTGGGGVASIVRVELQSVDCPAGTALAEVVGVACGLTDPEVGDILEVSDALGCILSYPEHLLIGLAGYAIRMDGAYECHWELLNLCCPDVACDGGLV